MQNYFNHLILILCLLAFQGCCEDDDMCSTTAAKEIGLNVNVKLSIGGVLYENVDATITVSGFDSANIKKWFEVYDYIGPFDNEFFIKNGFHHYTIEMQKWGMYDVFQLDAETLWQDRADGPMPVTYNLGGATSFKPLKAYIDYLEWDDGNLHPASKTEYEFNEQGKLKKQTNYSYINLTDEYIPYNFFEFVFDESGLLKKISGYYAINNKPSFEDIYEYYDDGNVSRITEENFVAKITATVDLNYHLNDNSVSAVYSFSYGGSHESTFDYAWKNIVSARTTQGGQLCNETEYSYDKNINPMKSLGYLDFFLNNYSINNKLTMDEVYLACNIPTLVPEHSEYEYDDQGYPTVATTHYKSGSSTMRMQRIYFYEDAEN